MRSRHCGTLLFLARKVTGCAAALLGAVGIDFECLLQSAVEGGEFPNLCASGYFGGAALSVFLCKVRIVLRAKSVYFIISCSDSLSRKYIRQILPNISIAITLYLLPKN